MRQTVLATAAVLLAAVVLGGCAAPSAPFASHAATPDPARRERLVAVTRTHELLVFIAGQPERVLERRPVTGLAPGDRLVGIDYRVARGVLYALSASGRLYTLDVPTGALLPVGVQAAALRLEGGAFGVDFNPAADRLRVVSDTGQNLRLHPDTGAVVDGDAQQSGLQPDPALHYAPGDAHAQERPTVAAAAYTYHPRDGSLTTNYAIDQALGLLVMQGSREGATPVVSPNTGQLRTVGPLGLGPLAEVSFDISDIGNIALMAARARRGGETQLYQVDLDSGAARLLGRAGDGASLIGLAIEP